MNNVTGIDLSIVLTDKHDIERLQVRHRIVGSPVFQNTVKKSSNACALRLGLEEIVLGITHFFMRLRCRECGCEYGKTNKSCTGSQESTYGSNTNTVSIQTDCRVISICASILEISVERKQQTCIVELLEYTQEQWEAARLRSFVFIDLWEKQYFIAYGSKFGADYITYKGKLISH